MPGPGNPPTIHRAALKQGHRQMTDDDWVFAHHAAIKCPQCQRLGFTSDGRAGTDRRFKCDGCQHSFGLGIVRTLRDKLSSGSITTFLKPSALRSSLPATTAAVTVVASATIATDAPQSEDEGPPLNRPSSRAEDTTTLATTTEPALTHETMENAGEADGNTNDDTEMELQQEEEPVEAVNAASEGAQADETMEDEGLADSNVASSNVGDGNHNNSGIFAIHNKKRLRSEVRDYVSQTEQSLRGVHDAMMAELNGMKLMIKKLAEKVAMGNEERKMLRNHIRGLKKEVKELRNGGAASIDGTVRAPNVPMTVDDMDTSLDTPAALTTSATATNGTADVSSGTQPQETATSTSTWAQVARKGRKRPKKTATTTTPEAPTGRTEEGRTRRTSTTPISSMTPVLPLEGPALQQAAIADLVASMRPRPMNARTPTRKPLPMSHVYLAGRRCPLGQWRATLQKLNISTRAVPEIQFIGSSIVDLWVYSQHKPQIQERLAAAGFKLEQYEPTSPAAVARPDLSVASRAKQAQAAYLNRLQKTLDACTNESVRSHAEVLISSLQVGTRPRRETATPPEQTHQEISAEMVVAQC